MSITSDLALMVNNYKQLSKEEEADLCKQMREGSTEARDRLFESCAPWAVKLATGIAKNRYGESPNNAKLFDVVQAGLCGLLRALNDPRKNDEGFDAKKAKEFDPAKGRLSTYCTWWVRNQCLTLIWEDRTIRLPRYLNGKDFEELRIPTVSFLIVEEEDEDKDKRYYLPKSLTYEHQGFAEVDEADDKETKGKRLKTVVKFLTEREQQILLQRSIGMTLKAVGNKHDICKERVRQIQNRAISDLKKIFNKKEKSNGKAKKY